MSSLLHNFHFWLSVSFILAVGFLYYKTKNKIVDFLNSKIEEIKKELKDSENVFQESLNVLNEKKEELKKSKQKNQTIREYKISYFEAAFEKALNNIENHNRNYKESFDTYIENEKKEQIENINQTIINDSIKIVKNYCSNLTPKEHKELIDQSISNIKGLK